MATGLSHIKSRLQFIIIIIIIIIFLSFALLSDLHLAHQHYTTSNTYRCFNQEVTEGTSESPQASADSILLQRGSARALKSCYLNVYVLLLA
jgi:hypothetical protein